MNVLHLWSNWLWANSIQLTATILCAGLVAIVLPARWARVRYGLWLVVLLKMFLPATLSAPWSLGNLFPDSVSEVWNTSADRNAFPPQPVQQTQGSSTGESPRHRETASTWPVHSRPMTWHLVLLWLAGALTYWGLVFWQTRQLNIQLAASESCDEGPLRVLYESVTLAMGLERRPDLILVESLQSPYLTGLVCPRIAIPQDLAQRLSQDELRAVLWHELVHYQRRDIWVVWAQVLAQGVFWFHPLVWWANAQLREAREASCDELVLMQSQSDVQQYADSILHVLSSVHGRTIRQGQVTGVFERHSQLQKRLEDMMRLETRKPLSVAFVWGAVAIFGSLLLPLAPSVSPRPAQADDSPARPAYPVVTQTSPKNFATDVPADLTEISVTFDRPMQKGMSWTGGPPHFPPIDRNRQPRWIDETTCVIPVKLQPGTYYRIGVNSQSHKNFKSQSGTPTPPIVLCFVTTGADDAIKSRVKRPKVVALEPQNGADGVDPEVTRVQVTFDRPMGEAFSWTGGGDSFPEVPQGQLPQWSDDRKTCTLPVRLKPNHDYRLGINSLNFNNFQSQWGVPCQPVSYSFSTSGR